MSKGDFEIKVKARDINGAESEWSDSLVVSMPRYTLFDKISYILSKMFGN
jgi:hypothetical protein